ncbi:hypothetical protein T12_6744, partial [Trichinella patagoniensis]
MHCKQVGSEKLPFSKLGRSPEKFENHCSRGIQPYVQWNLFHACQKLRRIVNNFVITTTNSVQMK